MQESGMTGNWFAAFAILAWPLIAVVLYRTKPVANATLWTLLAAFLLLPTGVSIKIPMVPALDKESVPNLCVFVGSFLLIRRRRNVARSFGIVEVLAVMLIVGPVITSLFNNDTIVVGERVLPGVGLYDGISSLLSQLLMFLPFIVGRRLFQESSDAELIVRCLILAGLFFSLPMLLEIRLSPQLSNWVYGFFPSGFSSEMRYGGFRPVVFMGNGLIAAFFVMTTFLAAVALWRVKDRVRSLPPAVPPIYLGGVLVLCKSAGALMYGIFVGVAVLWTRPRTQIRLAVILSTIALLYPILRVTDTFPDGLLVEGAASFDEERAGSLKFRFDQEQQLLDRASQRFTFGWGRYGRSRVYDEDYGKDTSVTDGAWIITLGQFGFVGFVAQFGLLAWPVYRASLSFKFIRTERDRVFFAVLALVVALGIVEQLPNASVSSWNWFLAGSLLGGAERIAELARNARRLSGGALTEVRSRTANA